MEMDLNSLERHTVYVYNGSNGVWRGKKYFIFLVSLIYYGTTPVIHSPLIGKELPYSIKKPLFFRRLPQKESNKFSALD